MQLISKLITKKCQLWWIRPGFQQLMSACHILVLSIICIFEVLQVSVVINELQVRFGIHAALLLVIDFQGPTAKGAVLVENEPNLMLHVMAFLCFCPLAVMFGKCVRFIQLMLNGPMVFPLLLSIGYFIVTTSCL